MITLEEDSRIDRDSISRELNQQVSLSDGGILHCDRWPLVFVEGFMSIDDLRKIITFMESKGASPVPEKVGPMHKKAEDGGPDWTSHDGGRTWCRPA